MANCGDMKEGDVYKCESCNLELQVTKTCACGSEAGACSVSLRCCGKDIKKNRSYKPGL